VYMLLPYSIAQCSQTTESMISFSQQS